MTLQITVEKRDKTIKNEALRAAGKIPAVYYGGDKEESASITIDYNEFIKMYREAGESTMITLKTPDGEEQALVQDFQQDSVTDKVTHVDFKIIEAGKSIEVTVPFEFKGVAPAVKDGLGILTKVMYEVDIRVLPKDLPSEIVVDISGLATLDDQVLIKDLKVADTIEFLAEDDAAVAVVSPIKEEPEEEEESGEIDFDSIEVEQKGKAEEEGEGGEDSDSGQEE